MDQTDHTLHSHIDRLNLLCRICGKRLAKSKEQSQPKKCEQYASQIKSVYGIDINTDKEDSHSLHICRKCYARLLCVVRAGANPAEKTIQNAKKDVENSKNIWSKFDKNVSVTECSVCSTYTKQSKGGRPSLNLQCRAADSTTSLQTASTSLTKSDDNGGGANYMQSQLSPCQPGPSQESSSLSQCTPIQTKLKSAARIKQKPKVDQALIRNANEIFLPFTKAEKNLFEQMIRLKMNHSSDGETVTVQTGGKPITLKRFLKAQTPSEQAKTPTRNKRARAVNKFRKGTSGSSDGDIALQLKKEIQKASKTAARKLYETTGLGTPQLTAKECVRIQNICESSNTKHKKVRAMLRKKGFKLCTEKEERQFKKDAQCTNFITEQTAVYFYRKDADTILKNVPVIKSDDLPTYVTNILNKLKAKVKHSVLCM